MHKPSSLVLGTVNTSEEPRRDTKFIQQRTSVFLLLPSLRDEKLASFRHALEAFRPSNCTQYL